MAANDVWRKCGGAQAEVPPTTHAHQRPSKSRAFLHIFAIVPHPPLTAITTTYVQHPRPRSPTRALTHSARGMLDTGQTHTHDDYQEDAR
jgi:hypothetical protein